MWDLCMYVSVKREQINENLCKSTYPEGHHDPLEICANLVQSLSFEFFKGLETAVVFRDW